MNSTKQTNILVIGFLSMVGTAQPAQVCETMPEFALQIENNGASQPSALTFTDKQITLADRDSTLPAPTVYADKNYSYKIYKANTPATSLILLGIGKGGSDGDKEPFIKEYLHQGYDVAVFYYTWQQPTNIVNRLMRIFAPLKSYFNGNHEDVLNVMRAIRRNTKLAYTQIIGHGECYSAFMFAKAQAHKSSGEHLFDKLVLDSGMLSVRNFIKAIFKDPVFCCNPLEAGTPRFIKDILSSRFIAKPMSFIIDACANEYSIENDLQAINIPVLYIRGSKDPIVSKDDFNTILKSLTQAPWKSAFITPFHHSNSFKFSNARAQYLTVTKAFIDAIRLDATFLNTIRNK